MQVRARVRLVAIVVAVSAVLGCQAQGDGAASSSPPQKCTRMGQTCEFSKNKLGSCVMRDNCTEDCLVCQSQH